MIIGRKAIYIGQDTLDIQNGEELRCIGLNYDDEIQPSFIFKSIENGMIIELHEEDIEWIKEQQYKWEQTHTS